MKAAETPRTVLEYLDRARRFLEGKGVETPRLEAEILLAHALSCRRLDLYLRFEKVLAPAERDRYRDLVTRRAAGSPTAYLTGKREFLGLEFAVTPAVLIPRPETELLVEEVLEFVKGRAGARVADVGTGSGCVAVALAVREPGVEVDATDLSEAALGVARGNAERHGVAGRVRFHQGDLLEPLRALGLAGALDAVVSNPPYISPAEAPSLPAEVRGHEPAAALFTRGDPLEFHRRLVVEAAGLIRPGGGLFLEVGAGQGAAVEEVLRAARIYGDLKRRKDFAGIERVVSARRKQETA